MHLYIEYKNKFERTGNKDRTCSKNINLSDLFEFKENLKGLILDDNKVRPIRSFNLTSDNGKTLSSGIFTVLGKLLINDSYQSKLLKYGK